MCCFSLVAGGSVCILGVTGLEYAAYVSWRLCVRHVLPLVLVVAATLRPETRISKRVSQLFFGHLGEPCCCGEEGRPLRFPHECPTMRTAMLKNAATVQHAAGDHPANSPVRPPRSVDKSRGGRGEQIRSWSGA